MKIMLGRSEALMLALLFSFMVGCSEAPPGPASDEIGDLFVGARFCSDTNTSHESRRVRYSESAYHTSVRPLQRNDRRERAN